jgi:hypothetical protein
MSIFTFTLNIDIETCATFTTQEGYQLIKEASSEVFRKNETTRHDLYRMTREIEQEAYAAERSLKNSFYAKMKGLIYNDPLYIAYQQEMDAQTAIIDAQMKIDRAKVTQDMEQRICIREAELARLIAEINLKVQAGLYQDTTTSNQQKVQEQEAVKQEAIKRAKELAAQTARMEAERDAKAQQEQKQQAEADARKARERAEQQKQYTQNDNSTGHTNYTPRPQTCTNRSEAARILGISISADTRCARAAWVKAINACHPDKFQDTPQYAEMTEQAKLVNIAYAFFK